MLPMSLSPHDLLPAQNSDIQFWNSLVGDSPAEPAPGGVSGMVPLDAAFPKQP